MALTRAQLLAGNSSQGIVLGGQVQGVTAGIGVRIDADGSLSIRADDPNFNGFVKTNNDNAYNGYVWPNVIGQPDQFLQLVDASGQLRWADASGFAVVVVDPNAPTPPDEGELWYDCTVGALKVFQNCNAPGGWTNVAQPGKEVTPANTSANPPFTNQGTPNAGTLANPYDCTVTTTTPGTSIFIVNEVTVINLAPNQFVPIVDMNAVANGGRFHFSNHYADATGTLVFETIFIDLPNSPSGTNYTAAIRVGYASAYIEAVVNVVAPLQLPNGGTITGNPVINNTLTYTPATATGGIPPISYTWNWVNDLGTTLASGSGTAPQTYVIPAGQLGRTISVVLTATDASLASVTATSNTRGPVTQLTLTSPGSISGTAATGQTLTYTRGSATGGVTPINYTWQWKNDLGTVLASGSGAGPQNYLVPATEVGRTISVTLTATDSGTPSATVSGITASTATITGTPITNVQFPTTIPGTASFAWGDGNGVTLTATDCIEFDVNGSGSFVTTATVNNSDVIRTQWKTTPACGGAAQNTTISGTLTSGGLVSTGQITINRVPTSVTLNPTTRTANVTAVIAPVDFSTSGANTAPLIWGTLSAGTNPQYSIDSGTTWITLPTSPNAANTIPPGVTAQVRYTTGGVGGTETLVLKAGVSNTVGQFQSATLTTTVSLTPFPVGVWNPLPSTGLNTIPGLVSGLYNGTSTTITPSGCIEVAVAPGGPWVSAPSTLPITPSGVDTLYARWSISSLCGGAASDTAITGSVSDGTYENTYNITVQRQPASFSFTPKSNAPLNTVEVSSLASITGINTTAYVTYGTGTTAGIIGTLEARIAGGGWTAIPASGTGLPIQNGQSLEVRFNTGSSTGAVQSAVINVGDGDNVKFTQGTYTVTNTANAAIPGLTFSPSATGPTASPANTNLSTPSLYGTVTATWPTLPTNPTAITSTGNLEFRNVTAAGSFGQTSQNFATGDVIEARWIATDATATVDGDTLTGDLTGSGYVTTLSLVVDKLPDAYDWGDVTGSGTSTQVTSSPVTIAGINCPVELTYTPDSTNPLTSVQASINGGAFTNIPTTAPGLVVDPADSLGTTATTILIRGTTGAAGGVTFSITTQIGDGTTSTDQLWQVETSAVPSVIQTPSITAPTGTNNNPAVFSPAGLTVTGSSYTIASGSPGAHTNSDWQVFSNFTNAIRNPQTSPITGVGSTQPGASLISVLGGSSGKGVNGVAANGSTVVACAGGNSFATLQRSTDSGNSWTQVSTVSSGGNPTDGFRVSNLGSIFICQGQVSSNNGATWSTAVNSGYTQAASNGTVFAGYNPSTGFFGTSTDGSNWTDRQSGVAGRDYNFFSAGSVFYALNGAGGSNDLFSTDGGITWNSGGPSTNGGVVISGGFEASSSTYIFGGIDATFTAAFFTRSSSPTGGTVQNFGSGSGFASAAAAGTRVWTTFSSAGGTTTFTPGGVSLSGAAIINQATQSGDFALLATRTALYRTLNVAQTQLTFQDGTDLSSMVVGDSIVEVGTSTDASGVIGAIGANTITLSSTSGTWTVGAQAKDTTRTITVTAVPKVSTNTITGTTPGSANWTQVASTSFGTSNILSAVYAGGLYVAGGTTATLATSSNGSAWTQRANGFGINAINTLAFGNGTYVAAGTGGKLETSANGTAWTPQTSSFGTTIINKVIYANGAFVAVGADGKLATSSNATSWTQQTSSFGATDPITTVTYGNGLFVAAGDAGKIATSPNGTTWAQGTSGFGTTNIVCSTFGKGLFVIGGLAGKLATSTNGTTWTQQTSSFGTDAIVGLSYYNGIYFATGQNGKLATSTDGINWTQQTSSFGATRTIYEVVSGNNLYVAVGEGGEIATATQPAGTTAISILAADTDGFLAGNTISNGIVGSGSASGVITAITGTTVTVSPGSSGWANGQNLYMGSPLVNVAGDTSNLTSYFIPQANLATSSTYYARVKYSSASTSSSFSPWASFGTASAFLPVPGVQFGGGYFAGQIRVFAGEDGGGLPAVTTIYNLIVAPVEGNTSGPAVGGALKGVYGGTSPTNLEYKTSASADAADAQNLVYGGTVSNLYKASGVHPLFNTTWLNNSAGPNGGTMNLATGGLGGGAGIGGYTDWYVPAKNELEVLYYYLKPGPTGTQPNSTSSGSNPNAVAPEPVSTNYTATNPAQTTAILFQGTNAEAFLSSSAWWSATEVSSDPSKAWRATFQSGLQFENTKTASNVNSARAVRRVRA